MYAGSNKELKLILDSALCGTVVWTQISKKRIGKLQHDGLLNSTDLRAFEKYVSCMSGKMARKLYTHQVEKVCIKGTRRALDQMCLHVDAEEHELGDLGEPANYKAALLDPESDKWLDTMNEEMQSIKDNEV
ncbi:hypothetical protein Tco_1020322 [Tanacetum coccineum]|uniref:Uncharacterized protein n=1 Tax=Tanacetum coccineum TaxID=301880 RepID=A0ABQ5G1X3_9ASTR